MRTPGVERPDALVHTKQAERENECSDHAVQQSVPRSLTHPKYRADIDGLRAIAVLSVVGYHAFPTVVSGGFIGVDLFFVISGFLITTIIVDSLGRERFSFIEFYGRRIRRIFPALLLVLAACFTLGWFVLLTDEYRQLGRHIAGGAGFVSNFLLWSESGYFDNAADTKPLLHLWSLGIEEQYYIIWPLLLWMAWKRRINPEIMVALLAIASAVLNIRGVTSDPVANFYSPQTRFWELMVGSFLACCLSRRRAFADWIAAPPDRLRDRPGILSDAIGGARGRGNVMAFCGAVLVACALALVNRQSAFPGWWAMLPVFGAALMIAAGPNAWLNRVVLSNAVLVWFGLISYPLYLIHWPALSFAGIVAGEALSNGHRLAIVLASILAAWATFRVVEAPIRSGHASTAKTLTLTALMLAVGYAGYRGYRDDGYGFRLRDRQDYAAYFENGAPDRRLFSRMRLGENYRVACDFYDMERYLRGTPSVIPRPAIARTCYERDPTKRYAVMIWGDSHGAHLYSGLRDNLPRDWQILQVTGSGCHPYVAVKPSATDHCLQSNWFALETIKAAKPDVVIVAQNDYHRVARMEALADTIRNLGVARVIFNGPTPHWTVPIPKTIANRLWINTPNRTFIGINRAVMESNRQMRSSFPESSSLKYADLIGSFCNDQGCLIYIGSDRKTGVTSWDEGHLTPVASDYLAKNLLVPLITAEAR